MYCMQIQALLTQLYMPHYTESVLTTFRTPKTLKLEQYKQFALYGFEITRQNTC